MKWKAKYTKTDYSNGSTRLKRVFAFLPAYVNGFIVWLSTYEILQAYIIEEFTITIEGKETLFANGKWKNLSKRLSE